jgi:hypothetical protein
MMLAGFATVVGLCEMVDHMHEMFCV